MAIAHTYSFATSVFTVTDNFDDTETITCGGKVYTIRVSPVADGDVDLGTDAAGTLKNLLAAINLDPNAGETAAPGAYDELMVENPDVICTGVTATTLSIKSKTPGTIGNSLPTTDTHGEGSWTSTVMANGVGDLESYLTSLFLLNQIQSELKTELLALTPDAD